eukprot:4704818-Prymnesium_polylepis.1
MGGLRCDAHSSREPICVRPKARCDVMAGHVVDARPERAICATDVMVPGSRRCCPATICTDFAQGVEDVVHNMYRGQKGPLKIIFQIYWHKILNLSKSGNY